MQLLLTILLILFTPKEENLKADLAKYLNSNLQGYEKINFEIINQPRIGMQDEISVDESRLFKSSGNMGYVPVIIKNKSGVVKSVLTVRLQLFKKSLVAQNTIKKGSEIKPQDFELILTDVAQIRGKIISELKTEHGLIASKNIEKGNILLQQYVDDLPLINRGDKIMAYVQSGNVIVSLDAIAREDGKVNQTIRVSGSDKKNYKARVIDNSSVQIIE